MLSLILTILLLIFGSCGVRSTVATPRAPEPALPPDVAIFTPDQAEAVSYLLPAGVDGYWQPQIADIVQLEADLGAYTLSTPELETLIPFDGDYQRQYLGYELEGVQYIYGNFFCDAFGSDWHEVWIDVEDGGDCYFSFSYQVGTRSFPNFYVNGEA